LKGLGKAFQTKGGESAKTLDKRMCRLIGELGGGPCNWKEGSMGQGGEVELRRRCS